MQQPDENSGAIRTDHPTPLDKRARRAEELLGRLFSLTEDPNNDAAVQQALRDAANVHKAQEAWRKAEAEIAARKQYDAMLYNMWREVGFFVHKSSDPQQERYLIRHKDGGTIQKNQTEITYNGKAAENVRAIELGVLEARSWQEGLHLEGTETFKATAYALAFVHGVRVKNYEPQDKASVELANHIIATHPLMQTKPEDSFFAQEARRRNDERQQQAEADKRRQAETATAGDYGPYGAKTRDAGWGRAEEPKKRSTKARLPRPPHADFYGTPAGLSPNPS